MADRLTRIVALGAICCLMTPLAAQQARIPPTKGGLKPPIVIPTFPEVPRDGWLRTITIEQDGKPLASEEARATEARIRVALSDDPSEYTVRRIVEAVRKGAAPAARQRPWKIRIRFKSPLFEVGVEVEVGKSEGP